MKLYGVDSRVVSVGTQCFFQSKAMLQRCDGGLKTSTYRVASSSGLLDPVVWAPLDRFCFQVFKSRLHRHRFLDSQSPGSLDPVPFPA